MIELICKLCNKKVKVKNSRKESFKYCSNKCKNKSFREGQHPFLGRKHSNQTKLKISKTKKNQLSSFKGRKHTEESKRKLSEANKGLIPWNKGKKGVQNGWNKGKKFSEETRRKMSDVRKGKYKGDKHPSWKGGKTIINGYRSIYCPENPSVNDKGYMAEHRLVMEKAIKRKLDLNEVVHHIDGNTLNNSIDNLHLFKNQSKHMKYHCFLRKMIKEELNNETS